MQLEDLSKDDLIAIVARQDESLVEERRINILLREQVEQHRKDDQPVQQPAPAPAFDAWYHRKTHMSREHAQISFDAGYAAAGQQPAPVEMPAASVQPDVKLLAFMTQHAVAALQAGRPVTADHSIERRGPWGVPIYTAPLPGSGRDAALEEAAQCVEWQKVGDPESQDRDIALDAAANAVRALAAHPDNIEQVLYPQPTVTVIRKGKAISWQNNHFESLADGEYTFQLQLPKYGVVGNSKIYIAPKS